jgi:hypothetical protein
MEASKQIDLSATDIRLCLSNAKRLMVDATKVSPESQLMLRELALEELAKGYMVYFRLLTKNPAQFKNRVHLPHIAGSEKIAELLQGHRDMFSEAALRRAFWDHEVKVEFIELLAEVVLQAPPIFVDDRNVDTRGLPFGTVVRLARGRIRRYSQLGIVSNRRVIAKIRERVKREVNGRLDALAKRATYVDLASSGPGCVLPNADKELSDALGHFDRTWAAALSLAAQILLKA